MKTLAAILRALALTQPDKTAVVDQDGHRRTSYRQLDEMGARVARLLIDSGVGKNDIIPVLLPRDVRYVAAMAGVFKAGAACAPLDPAYPAERIGYIKKDCGCPLAIDEDFMSRALCLAPEERGADPAASDRALVTYTSGSTGRPKGVVQSWTGLMRQLSNTPSRRSPRPSASNSAKSRNPCGSHSPVRPSVRASSKSSMCSEKRRFSNDFAGAWTI